MLGLWNTGCFLHFPFQPFPCRFWKVFCSTGLFVFGGMSSRFASCRDFAFIVTVVTAANCHGISWNMSRTIFHRNWCELLKILKQQACVSCCRTFHHENSACKDLTWWCQAGYNVNIWFISVVYLRYYLWRGEQCSGTNGGMGTSGDGKEGSVAISSWRWINHRYRYPIYG